MKQTSVRSWPQGLALQGGFKAQMLNASILSSPDVPLDGLLQQSRMEGVDVAFPHVSWTRAGDASSISTHSGSLTITLK